MAQNGLTGNYYNNPTRSGPAVTRIDPIVNFNWNTTGSQDAPPAPVQSTNFSVRWTGQLQAPVTGTYTFSTNADDAAGLWINNQLVVTDLRWNPPATIQPIDLQQGQMYNVVLDYMQDGGPGRIYLSWAYPGQQSQIIPSTALFPSSYGSTAIGRIDAYSGGGGMDTVMIAVNNRVVITKVDHNHGLNVVVVHPDTGEVVVAHSFNTWDAAYENDASLGGTAHPSNEFVNSINSIPDGYWVTIAVRYSAANYLTDQAKQVIAALGSKRIGDLKVSDSWAFLGQKGYPSNTQEDYSPAASSLGATVGWPASPRTGTAINNMLAYSGGWNSFPINYGWIIVNNKFTQIPSRGLNVMVVDPTTGQAVGAIRTFDTWGDAAAAGRFVDYINNNVADGQQVIIAVYDEGSYRLTENAKQTIEALGSTHIRDLRFRESWAFIGQKGGDRSKAQVRESYGLHSAAAGCRFL